jgi:hypothetical protein
VIKKVHINILLIAFILCVHIYIYITLILCVHIYIYKSNLTILFYPQINHPKSFETLCIMNNETFFSYENEKLKFEPKRSVSPYKHLNL